MRVAFVFPSIPTRNDREQDFALLTQTKKDWLGQEAESVKNALDKRGSDHAVSIHSMYTYDAEATTNGVEWFATCPPKFMTTRWWYQGKQWSGRWFKKILDWQPDLVHWQMNSYAYTFHLAARGLVKNNVPYVYQHHGPHLARKSWVRKVLKYPHDHAERGIYLTKYHEQQYTEGLGLDSAKNVIIPVGYSTRFKLMDQLECRKEAEFTGDPIFFWCGGINKRKDPLCVLEAFDKITTDFPDARFYIAGYGPQDEEVDQLIESRPGLKKQVIRLGYVDNQKIPMYENASDIFVMGSHGEGFALASMEAMSCGSFPVLTKLDCFVEQTQNGHLGQHFDAGDVTGCAEAMKRAINDVRTRQGLREEVSAAVQQWTWPNSAERLVDLYEQVLSGRS